MKEQEIKGSFRLRLKGIPLILFKGILELRSEGGSRAKARTIFIGPFLIGYFGRNND